LGGNDRRPLQTSDIIKGKVAKIASFGAFVELEDEIDGPVRNLPWNSAESRSPNSEDVLNVGDDVEAWIIEVGKVERRIGLSFKAVAYISDRIKRETTAFDSLHPTTDLVGLEQAALFASKVWRPGQGGVLKEDQANRLLSDGVRVLSDDVMQISNAGEIDSHL
jgi:small subunit ribosomal protein S1